MTRFDNRLKEGWGGLTTPFKILAWAYAIGSLVTAMIVGVILVIIALAVVGGIAKADPWGKAYVPTFSPSVELLNGTDGLCTAFYVGGGIFLSAGHCVTETNNLFVKNEDGDRRKVTGLVYANVDLGQNDFYVLAADPDAVADLHVNIAPLDCDATLSIGRNVRLEGYPGIDEHRLSYLWGRVSGKINTFDGVPWKLPLVPLNVAVTGGASGSPVYDDATNKVIGILVGADPQNRSLTWAVPISAVCQLAHSMRVLDTGAGK